MTIDRTSPTWIADTEVAVQFAKDATDAANEVGRLEETTIDFARLVTQFQNVVVAASVAREVGWAGRTPQPEIFRDLRESSTGLESRPMARLTRALDQYLRDVRQDLVDCWGEHANSRLGSVADLRVLAGTLQGVDDVAGLSIALDRTLGNLARSQSSLPTAESARLLREAETQLAELEAALQPPAVRAFLTAVARGGASVELLTPDVLEWIRSHRATRSFRVTAGSPASATDD
jgi:hypothetical protein